LALFGQAVSEEKIFLTLANQKKELILADMIISLWNLLQYHSIVSWAIQAQWAEPLVFLTIVVVQNVPLLMTESSMATCYLVVIPHWERGRDRKHLWSTTQHLEQLRSHPRGITHFRSYDVTSVRRSCRNTYRVMKKNPIIFWKAIIRFCFGFQTDTIRIISCHGNIRLPVWLQDLQALENRCLSDGLFTTANTWWIPSQIGSYSVMVNIRGCMEP
jgi:hypothetical protein